MTTKQFYTSNAWRNLLTILRQERTGDDGLLRCAYCGKPIVKKYDCVGHHKKELNEVNVNDPSIALNPDNVELIHFGCHNIIHQRFGAGRQQVFIVYGCVKAGKSRWVETNATSDDLIIDVERIEQAIGINKSKRLRANIFRTRDALIDQVRTRTGQWRNAYIIGGYPLRSDRDRLCDLLNAQTIFIDTPEEECLERCDTEEEREYVKEWQRNFTP